MADIYNELRARAEDVMAMLYLSEQAGLSEHPRIINGNVVRAPVAAQSAFGSECHIEAGADSRLLHNVTIRTFRASIV